MGLCRGVGGEGGRTRALVLKVEVERYTVVVVGFGVLIAYTDRQLTDALQSGSYNWTLVCICNYLCRLFHA